MGIYSMNKTIIATLVFLACLCNVKCERAKWQFIEKEKDKKTHDLTQLKVKSGYSLNACGMVCTLTQYCESISYNATTQQCILSFLVSDDKQLKTVDASGFTIYDMTPPLEENERKPECIKVVLNETKPNNSMIALYSSTESDVYADPNSTANLTCDIGYYMTVQNEIDSLWYTSFTDLVFTCTFGYWIASPEQNCIKLPDVIPVYVIFYQLPYDHVYITDKTLHDTTTEVKKGIAFQLLESTAYCPEKEPLYALHRNFVNNIYTNHYYAVGESAKVSAETGFGYIYENIVGYVVREKGQCGATKALHVYSHLTKYDHYYEADGNPAPFDGYSYGGIHCYVW